MGTRWCFHIYMIVLEWLEWLREVRGKVSEREKGLFPEAEAVADGGGGGGGGGGRQGPREEGIWKDGEAERESKNETEKESAKPASCERLQSFLTLSSVPADSMSHPTMQQGQSRAISQAYSALQRPQDPGPCKAGTPQSLLSVPRSTGGRIGQWCHNCHTVRGSISATAGTAVLEVTQQDY